MSGAFLIAAPVTVVMEFETDVPQSAIVSYLPVVVGTLTFTFALLRHVDERPWPAPRTAAGHPVLWSRWSGVLLLLGHSLPTVMPTVAAALAFDATVQGNGRRGTVATATASHARSHMAAHVLQPARLTFNVVDIHAGAGIGPSWPMERSPPPASGTPRRPPGVRVALAAAGVFVLARVDRALAAHDPGQGVEIAPVALSAAREATASRFVPSPRTAPAGSSSGSWPDAAGVLTLTPHPIGDGRFRGEIEDDDSGRCFVHVEVKVYGARTEAWLPVDTIQHVKTTELHRAPRSGPTSSRASPGWPSTSPSQRHRWDCTALPAGHAFARVAAPATGSCAGISDDGGSPRKVNR